MSRRTGRPCALCGRRCRLGKTFCATCRQLGVELMIGGLAGLRDRPAS